jgi:hypothetical protein
MTSVIERNYNEVQKKTTHVLVEQKVILSEQELIDGFLDKLNESKILHAKAIPEYRALIDMTVEFLSESRNVSELVLLSVSIESLIDITKRLIHTFGDARFNNFYSTEVKEYKMLMSDIQEILIDVQGRISNDKKLMDVLNNL